MNTYTLTTTDGDRVRLRAATVLAAERAGRVRVDYAAMNRANAGRQTGTYAPAADTTNGGW